VTLSGPPQSTNAVPFLSKHLEAEFLRCCDQLGPEAEAGGAQIDSRTVMRAHFLVAEYFLGPGRGMAAVGPRSVQLLQSAVSRQYVAYDGNHKWTEPFDLAATLFYGLVKNHPFHDANKRTALLTALYQLQSVGRLPVARQEDFEELTIRVADGDLASYREFALFTDQPDPEVRFLSWFLRRHTRSENKREYYISFKQLERVLSRFGYYFGTPHNNRLDVLHTATERHGFLKLQKRSVERRLTTIGFRNMGEDVSQTDIRLVRRATGLTSENGYDSDVLFSGLDPMESLIAEYYAPLRRLAKK
jgi:death-on-curing family protein